MYPFYFKLYFAGRTVRGLTFKNLCLTFVVCALSSCALLDGYKNNLHSVYHKALNDEIKEMVAVHDSIELPMTRTYLNHEDKGILLITKHDKKKNRYNFVERGLWVEKPTKPLDTAKDHILNRRRVFDRYGNVREKETYTNYRKGGVYFLADRWTSEVKVIEGDSMLIQHLQYFNIDGSVSHMLSVAVPNYQELKSGYLKTKYKIGKEYEYDREGNIVDSTTYKLSDRVVKKGYY